MYKIAKTLDNLKNPEWESLLSSTLGEGVHPNRIQGFLLSREAKAVHEGFLTGFIPKELELEGYHQLINQKEFTLSLSHSKDMGAAIVAKKADFLSLGIDVESESRVVKDSIIERISHSEDLSLRKIELWCLKEAAFKALMNSQNFESPLEFSSIKIAEHQWFHSPSGLEGEWILEIQNGLVIAKAFLKN